MKNALIKSSLREIKSTLSRFLSIFGIVAIGVGFFAGVKAASPDMRNTVDDYLDEARLADLRLVSTFGFDEKDIAAVKTLDGAEVYPSYFTDLVAHYDDRSPAAARLISLGEHVLDGDINALYLVEGRLPENEHECAVNSTKMLGGPSIGSKVSFTDNKGGEPDEVLSVSEYTIVGSVRSAMYIDKTTRGSTSVGNGVIESIYYIPESNFCVEYNTEVYIRFPELAGYNCYLSEYKDAAEALSEKAEAIGTKRAAERYSEIKSEAEDKIADAQAELDDKEKEYNEKIAEAEKEIADGEREIAENEKKIADGEVELAEGEKSVAEGEAAVADGEKQLADAESAFALNEKFLPPGTPILESARREIEDGRKRLEEGKAQLEEGRKQLEDGRKQLADAKEQLADAKKKLEDGKKELEDKRTEGAEKIAEAKAELDDARKALDDLDEPKWYVFTRDDTPGYSEYGENADRINNIALVFPVFFIIVAMLVCLTTMTRMIEEQRVVIGTLKALGYGGGSIIFRYMFYAVSATVLGAVFGCAVGMYLFPYVIISAYGMMYDLPSMSLSPDIATGAAACIVFTAAIAVTVLLTARSSLSEQAAQLMRPKAPKNGKRILLERVTPVWKHFNFSAKVTARNLFRYKRKMLMTVIGISGCTALLVTGFALHDSINDIIAKQFEDIQSYQGIFAYDRDEHPEAADEAAKVIAENGGDSVKVYQKRVKVSANDRTVEAYISVPSEPEKFTEFFDLRSRATHEKFSLTDESTYIDEKMSLLLNNIGGGDTIEIEKSDTEKVTVTVTAPFENYPNHYIYMTEAGYERIFGEKPGYNVLYFRHGLGTGDGQDRLGEELLKTEGALNVTFNSDTMRQFTQMLEALSLVIMVIIASAGMLAFVVMYDLTNINITERIREIATLKVLGFYDGEVDSYIFRENILLSLLGTAAGLVLGVFLARFVIMTAEVDIVMFGRDIYPMSFILAAVITMVFSLLVTLAMHKRLQKVNMIEALKSVE